MQPLSLSVVVSVNASRPHPVEIMTEPACEGPLLHELIQLAYGKRASLMDGTYTLTYTVEHGIHMKGTDGASGSLLGSLISDEVATMHTYLRKGVKRLASVDEQFVEACATSIGQQILSDMLHDAECRFDMSELQIVVGCPVHGLDAFTDRRMLGALLQMPVPDDEEKKAALEGEIDRLQKKGVEMLPSTAMFLVGTSCRNPFERFLNAKLQMRVDDLLPAIREAVPRCIERELAEANTQSAAIRARLNLT